MTTRQTLFVAIVVSLVLGIHLYLGWRLFGRSGLARWRAVGRGVLALSAALVLVAFPLARALPRSSALLHVQYAGFFAMGLVLVLFPLTLLRDVVRLGGRALAAMRRPAPVDPA